MTGTVQLGSGFTKRFQLTNFDDEELKMHVYKSTIQALINQILLEETSDCDDCIQRIKKTCRNNAKTNNIKIVMAMDEIERQKFKSFELIREIFGIDEETHVRHMTQVKQQAVAVLDERTVKIEITIVCVQVPRLTRSSTSGIFITLELGEVKKRTATLMPQEKLNIGWNETFNFVSHNPSDKIKVQVWDEDEKLICKLKSLNLTRDANSCLGQSIIGVKTLSDKMNVWYELKKDTENNAAIRLDIKTQVDGDPNFSSPVPYHVQYSLLHEKLFQSRVAKFSNDLNAWNIYFEESGQEIIDEFAMSYEIEPIYQAMTHFRCLFTKSYATRSLSAASASMNSLLAKITAQYTQTESTSGFSPSARFASCNFGEENFIKLLDQLYNFLRIELSMYRTNYPASNQEKLMNLKSSIELVTWIMEFRLKVQELWKPPRASTFVQDCVKACLRSNYQYIFENCDQLYTKEFQLDSDSGSDCNGPSLYNLNFWYKMIHLIVSIVREDKNIYAPIFSQFSGDWTVGEMSAATMWDLFAVDIKFALEEHEQHQLCKPSDYKNFYLQIEEFYNEIYEIVEEVSLYKVQSPPEYHEWFEPFLDKNEDLN